MIQKSLSEVSEMREIAAAYQDFVVAHGLERAEVFETIATRYAPASVLYPGCFLHLTPAFYFPRVAFLDKNERAAALFAQPHEVEAFVNDHKHYRQAPRIRFWQHDYNQALPLGRERYELLIVLHAPGALAAGKPWLAPGGLLLVNETYGQAQDAFQDPDFDLLGLFKGKGYAFANESAARKLQPRPVPGKQECLWLFRRQA